MKRLWSYIIPLVLVLPLLTILYLSLVMVWAYPALWDATFTSSHWQAFFKGERGLLSSFLGSLLLSGSMAVLATAFGYYFSQRLFFASGKNHLLRYAFYPYLIAPVVLGVMLQYYFVRWGLTGTIAGVFLAQALFILPYGVLLLSTFWTDHVRQLALQAGSLGASALQVDRLVIWPMARPWLLLCLVQCFLISWFEYGITQVIGLGKVETLTIQVMHFVKEANPHRAALAACLMILPLFVLLLLNRRLLTKRQWS